MTTWILYSLLGLGIGAVYAAIGMGVILVYRGSGVVNFAHGAMAMYPAMVFIELRQEGELVLPWVGLPARIDLGSDVAFVPALVLALLVAAFIGLVAHRLVFWPLREAPPVTRVMASVGLTIVLQGMAIVHFGLSTRTSEAILPAEVVRIFGRNVPRDRFYLAGFVILVGLVLWAIYRYTRFGLATRAAAETEKGATLMGYSPAFLGSLNWLMAALLAGLAGILMTPISGVNPFNYSLFVVPALATALAGRLKSFSITLAVGLALGMFEALSVHLTAERIVPKFLLSGFDSAVPFFVIVVLLALAGRAIPGRGVLLEESHPRSPTPTLRPIPTALVLATGAYVVGFGSSGLRLATMESMIIGILILSIVVLSGFAGQISLAQLAFAGFSAFMLANFADDMGIPFPWSPLLAIASTTVLGTLVGLPAVRIRGIQLAIVTMAAAVAIEQLLFRNGSFTGIGGTAHVPTPEIFGVNLGIIGTGEYPQRAFGFVVYGALVLCSFLVMNLRRSRMGRRFLAVRANERAAAASGVHVARTKLTAAAVASFLAGVSGVLMAYKNVDFSNVGFEAARGLQYLALAYVGGIATTSGAVMAGMLTPAGVFFTVVSSGDAAPDWQFVATGVGLILVATRWSNGLAGLPNALRRLVARIARPEEGADPPAYRKADVGIEYEVVDADDEVPLIERGPASRHGRGDPGAHR